MLRSKVGGLMREILKSGGQVRHYVVSAPEEFGGIHWREKLHFMHMPEFALEPLPQQKTFAELKEEWDLRTAIPPERQVNIGLPRPSVTLKRQERTAASLRNTRNAELERQARNLELKVSISDVKNEWRSELGPAHERTIAEHYGIYKDLFQDAYFYPLLPMTIAYEYNDEYVTPVCNGNIVPTEDARTCPYVEFDGKSDHFYTLVMTNPDGHLVDNNAEYLHWGVCNMTGDDVASGEQLVDYLQPFPVRGTGFHRHVFVLFQHPHKLDFSPFKRSTPCTSLSERTFSTMELHGAFDGELVPVGLRFFQSDWDRSVSDVYHHTLKMREPEFEYMHPPFYHPPQAHYPNKQPFDRYYDRYRDKKELREEVLKMKLAMISPKEPHPKLSPWASVHEPKGHEFSWLRRRRHIMNRRLEQYRDLPK